MDLLRFFTAGNVDDGKSTLIGRLLYDSDSISTDIIQTLTKQSKTHGSKSSIDLALLTDGLRAEREQGITIDVAYKYFSSKKRKFIIADTPGHEEYTRNMFTGASTAELAIILVDARNGITDQTRRHSIISSILKTPKVLICINKMDLVGYNEEVYKEIVNEYKTFLGKFELNSVDFIPTSALNGDNVVNRSENMIWYNGPSLLQYLNEISIPTKSSIDNSARFQVQYIIRPQSSDFHDYRGYAGTVINGDFEIGQEVMVLPSEIKTKISKIESNLKLVSKASKNQPIILHLENDIDLSRGNSVVSLFDKPKLSKSVNATICWMDKDSFREGQKFVLQQGSYRTKAVFEVIKSKLNIHTYEDYQYDGFLKMNEIAKVKIKTAEVLSYDSYSENKQTGSFILINENTNLTIAAGVID